MSNYFYLICLLLCCSILSIEAQILPPELSCVRSDSVFWDVPNKNCNGPFNAYLLYGSTSQNGPYDLISSISNPTQLAYFHNSAHNQEWFYYMETDADCPGQATISSDTISNQIPEVLAIDFVSVQGNQAVINWTPNTNDQSIGHTIYRVTDMGTNPIETVFNQNIYIDPLAMASSQIQGYALTAVDACANESPIDLPHFTTYMVLGEQLCERTVELTWIPYQNWSEGIERQEIWLSTGFENFELLTTLSDTASQYIFDVFEDEVYHCFHIAAIEKETGFRSISNESCLTVNIIEPVQTLDITNINITNDNQIELEWTWNTNADLANTQILRTNLGNDAVDTIEWEVPNPLLSTNNYLDESISIGDTYYSYAINTVDACGKTLSTDFIKTLYLEGTALQNRTNQLSWTPSELPNIIVNNYQLFQIDRTTGIETLLMEVDGTITEAIDVLNPRFNEEADKCYVLQATATLSLADGTSQVITSRSNTTCVQQFATLYMPNAFTPNGKNPIFKPVIVFGDASSEYEFTIFDRWGGKLFESTEIEKGWDGRSKNGRDLPKGTYTYSVRLVQPNGETIAKEGVLVLLR